MRYRVGNLADPSVMNGLLATACVHYVGPIARWRLLFIVVGAITFGWSLLLFALLPANPTSAWWLTLRQRVIATRRMAAARTGMANKTFKWDQCREALLDPKTWLYFAINVVLNIPNGGLITFNSIIVKTLGFTLQQTTLLGIPTGKRLAGPSSPQVSSLGSRPSCSDTSPSRPSSGATRPWRRA